MSSKGLAIALILLLFFISEADGISLSVSGGSGGNQGSVSMRIDADDDAAVQSEGSIDGADISPITRSTGRMRTFEQIHQVTDNTGKHAETYVKVVNGRNMRYSSKVLPRRGNIGSRPWVSAEEWLSVGSADYVKCSALASYPVGNLSAAVSAEIFKGSLSGYYNKAYASSGYVEATQTIQDERRAKKSMSGNDILLNAWSSNDAGDNASVNTEVKYGSVNAFSNKATATSTDAYASILGLDTTGSEIQVASQESGSPDMYSLKSSLLGNMQMPAKYKGDATAASGQNTTQTIANATGNTVTIEDSREKNGAQQKVTLQSVDGSFSGTAKSWNSGHILQDYIDLAENGDNIKVGKGIYEGNNIIDKSLNIEGSGAGNTIVDGHRTVSVFMIGKNNPDVDVALSGMTIRNGTGTRTSISQLGGGILNYGRLTVVDSNISSNDAVKGGGVFNYGTVNLIGSSISSNRAHDGGGIYSAGTLELNGGSITNNTALIGGGGIYNYYGTMTMNGDSITNNTALHGGGGIVNWYSTITMNGGSINNNIGNGIDNRYGTVIMNDGSITNNNGGGISNNRGIITMNGGSITNNFASYHCGGIYNYYGTITMNGGSITNNTASLGGGIFNSGTITMNGGSITNNTAVQEGGGIHNSGTITMNGGSITNNTALHGSGGGIKNTNTYKKQGIMIMNGGSINNNTALYRGGGIDNAGIMTMNGGSITNNTALYGGGGISNSPVGTLELNGGSITNNTAHNDGGGIFNEWGIITMNGGSITNNTAYSTGGGIYNKGGLYNPRTVTMNGGSITNNTASYGGGIYNGFHGTVNLISGSINNNTATAPSPSGGGIYNLGIITGNTSLVYDNTPDQIAP